MIWIFSNTTALALVAFIILCGLLAFGVLAQQVIVGVSRIGVLLAMDHYKSLSAHTIIVRVEHELSRRNGQSKPGEIDIDDIGLIREGRYVVVNSSETNTRGGVGNSSACFRGG